MVIEILKKSEASSEGTHTREVHALVGSFFHALDQHKAAVAGPFIEVSDVVRKLGKVYERIRGIVDYRDEHLLRRAAIERIVKRRFDPENAGVELARDLVEELIRAGYLPNASVPERSLKDITQIVSKYATIERALRKGNPEVNGKIRELRGLLACELDEFFGYDAPITQAVRTVGKILRANLVFRGKIDERVRDLQILLASERALRSQDRSWLSYALLRASVSDWDEVLGERAEEFARHYPAWSNFFSTTLDHPLRHRLLSIAKRYAVLFTLLFDLSKKFPGELSAHVTHVDAMREHVLDAYMARYRKARKRLRSSAVRAVVYLLLTKFLLALLLEVPYDLTLVGHIKWLPITINLLFPPVFMSLVAFLINLPSKRNTGAILTGMDGLIEHGVAGNVRHEVRVHTRRHGFLNIMLNLVYVVTYVVTFGAIVWFLRKIGFTFLGVLIFLFFMSVVSFFAIRIRRNVRELLLFVEKERGFSTLFDFFTLPVVRAGQWMSESFQRINVFVFILDIIIEAPLQMTLEVLEHWIAFFREKKEEVY